MSSPCWWTPARSSLSWSRRRRRAWVVEQLADLPAPFATCEPVLTETFHLVSKLSHGVRRFFELLGSGLLMVDFDLMAEHAALAALVHKYRDVPMSLADACLVRMAELAPKSLVFTLDGDFRIYRTRDRGTRHQARRRCPR